MSGKLQFVDLSSTGCQPVHGGLYRLPVCSIVNDKLKFVGHLLLGTSAGLTVS